MVAALKETDGAGARLVDCLTLWLSNLLQADRDWAQEAARLADALKGQRSPGASGRVVEAVQSAKGRGQIAMIRWLVAAESGRPADEIDRPGVITALMSNHSKQVQSVCMVRIHGEDCPVQRLGLVEPAGAMQGKCL